MTTLTLDQLTGLIRDANHFSEDPACTERERECFAKDAGRALLWARERVAAGEYAGGRSFADYLRRECGMLLTRADDLVAVERRQKTYRQVCDRNAERLRALSARQRAPAAPNKRGRPPKGSLFDEAIRELTKVAKTKTYEQVLAIVNYAKEI